jgi:hypothetical protein
MSTTKSTSLISASISENVLDTNDSISSICSPCLISVCKLIVRCLPSFNLITIFLIHSSGTSVLFTSLTIIYHWSINSSIGCITHRGFSWTTTTFRSFGNRRSPCSFCWINTRNHTLGIFLHASSLGDHRISFYFHTFSLC